MNKLPDFSKCVELQELLRDMGIQTLQALPKLEFTRTRHETRTVVVPNTQQLEFAKKIKMQSIPIIGKDINFDKDGLIEINGLKCCIYIKNQSTNYDLVNKKSGYRFHLCNCQTIQTMTNDGRKGRYVATARDDEMFEVNVQGYDAHGQFLLNLELCQNCIIHLRSIHKYDTPFTLKNFYEKYQSEVPQDIKKTEQVAFTEKYAPNHKEIADRYKLEVNYICQCCGVNCSAQKNLLHMHHADGDGQNNSSRNLHILCVACHAQQARHGHMKSNKQFFQEIKSIYALREEQGITSLFD